MPILLHEFKYNHKKKIGRLLGKTMGNLVKNDPILSKAELIVPVPLHPARKRERRYNQSEILAEEVSKITGIETLNILKRTKNTKTQTELSPTERRKNVKNAFCVRKTYKKTISNKRVLLIDDVMTTGATLDECSKILLKEGAIETYGVVIAGAWKERE